MDDQTLLCQYVATGDSTAFKELTQRYFAMVRGVCVRILGNSHDAEEIAQECFLELSRHAADVHTSLPGWLHRAATSRSLNAIRSRTRRKRREKECGACEGATTSLAEAAEPELHQLIQEALKELPEDLRLPVVLHYVDGKTQRDVAVKLGVNQSTISRRMQDALRLLRDRLTQAGYATTAPAVVALIQDQTTTSAHAAVTEIAVVSTASQTCTSPTLLGLLKGWAAVLLPVLGYLLVDGWLSLFTALGLVAYVARYRPTWAAEVMASFGQPNFYQHAIFSWNSRKARPDSDPVNQSLGGCVAWSLLFVGLSALFAFGTAKPPWGTVTLGLAIATVYLVSAIRMLVVQGGLRHRQQRTTSSNRIETQTAASLDASLNWLDATQMGTIGLSGLGNTALLLVRAESGIIWPAAVLCALVSLGMTIAAANLVVRLMARERMRPDSSPDPHENAPVSSGTLTVMATGTALVAALSAWIVCNPSEVRGDSLSLAAIQTSMLGWMIYRIAAFHRLASPQFVRRVIIATLIGCFVLNSGMCLANWLPTGLR